MGCDIHCFVEVRKNGKWEYVKEDKRWGMFIFNGQKIPNSIYSSRNYLLFGLLASVRSPGYDEKSIPRGLPLDISKEVFDIVKAPGYHDRTYFTLRDLLDWDVWHRKDIIIHVKKFYSDCIGRLMLLGDLDDVRLIICFDS